MGKEWMIDLRLENGECKSIGVKVSLFANHFKKKENF